MALVSPRCGFEQVTRNLLPPVSPYLWYDPSDPSARTLSGSNITALNSKSANANTLTTASSAGTIVLAPGDQNGLDTARFLVGYMTLASTLGFADNYTFASIVKIENTSTTVGVGFGRGVSGGVYTFYYQSPNYGLATSTTKLNGPNSNPFDTNYHLFTVTVSGSTIQAYLDNSSLTMCAGNTQSKTTPLSNFGGNPTFPPANLIRHGDILLFNSVLSGANLTGLYSWAKAKWRTP